MWKDFKLMALSILSTCPRVYKDAKMCPHSSIIPIFFLMCLRFHGSNLFAERVRLPIDVKKTINLF